MKRIFVFTSIFLLIGITCMEPKCSSMKKTEAIKIVTEIRSQANFEQQQQIKQFTAILAPYLKGDIGSTNRDVFFALFNHFGKPDDIRVRKFNTGYTIQESQVNYSTIGHNLYMVVYVVYWNKGGDPMQLDPFGSGIQMSDKYDILCLQFINDEKLIGYLIQCKR